MVRPADHYASMPLDEVKRRAEAHRDEEFRRLQALGLEPSDEEIEAVVEEHARVARGEGRMAAGTPRSLWLGPGNRRFTSFVLE